MTKKVIIVGGVAGGASTAARLRRLEEDTEIIIFERDEYISYANCGLPYFLSGVIKERDSLLVQTPKGMKKRFNIDVRVNSEVVKIYPAEKEVEVQEKNGRKYRESYDRLDSLIPLAGPANKQGRIAADVLAGRKSSYKGTQGTAIAKIFDLAVASTGANEKTLHKLGIPCQVSFTHSGSGADYYPGSAEMTIKLIFAPQSGKILGAQIVGTKGVDKRIDDLAGALGRGGSIFDLTELELAYAPPFSSAKDPVNMAGYVAANIVKGDVAIVQGHELAGLDPQNTLIIDVRTPAEYMHGHVPGAVNIPVDLLRERLSEVPRAKDIIVYCLVGIRAYASSRILRGHGFTRVRNLSGGWKTYSSAETEKALAEKV